jgi:hypothetical protein
VDRVDTVPFRGGTLLGGAGPFHWWSPFELADLADQRQELAGLSSVATASAAGLELEGLPGRFSSLVVDGVRHTVARHWMVAPSAMDGAAFPLPLLRQSDLTGSAEDIEWPGQGSAFLSAHSRRGSGRYAARVTADAGGDGSRAGLVVSGPLIRDTAHVAMGVFARRLEATLPAPWPGDSLTDSLSAIALDSAGVDLAPYARPLVRRTDVLAAYGRLDWQITSSHVLAARASYATVSSDAPDLGDLAPAVLAAPLESQDISGAATLTSRLGERTAQEVRVGVDRSVRDFGAASLTGTAFTDAGLGFGSPGTLPGRFTRTSLRATGTVHVERGSHRFKAGLALSFSSHDHTFASGRGGDFTFAGRDEFRQKNGVFVQTVGSLPVAVFKTSDVGLFVQDRWAPAPGLELAFGLRYERERLPADQPVRNQEWLARSGLDNTNVGSQRRKLSPRFSFRWSAGEGGQWVLAGSSGIGFDEVDPGTLGDLITHAGGSRVRRAVGPLGFWPGVPDSSVAPVMGPALTLLHPDFEAPRTARTSLAISRSLGSRGALHLHGAYRHTDFLPRRTDLNLLPAAADSDQYGRPIYGSLQKLGTVLAATPGSNRRFGEFDLVTAVNPDGYSDHYAFTAALERAATGWLGFAAAYTYSRTRDNWVGARAGTVEASLTPFADTIQGRDWTRGVSDFDVPHRLNLAAEVNLSRRFGARIVALYRYRSGYPFTPGFRAGVDANGDGSAFNDPAYVTDTVAGFDSLVAGWDCLRRQIGRFAERNSCRTAASRSLDLRLVVRLATMRGSPAELVVDALNLVQSDVGIVDNALYLVDRNRPLDTSTPGLVVVPLVANPGFGRIIQRRAPERAWRVGLRIGT